MITQAHENWENKSFEKAIEAQKIFEEGLESSDIGHKRSRKEIGFQVLTQAKHYRVFAGEAATDSAQEAIDEGERLMKELEKNIAFTPDPMSDAIKKAAPDYPFADEKLSAEIALRRQMEEEASALQVNEDGKIYQDGKVFHGTLVQDGKGFFVLDISSESPERDSLERGTKDVQFDNFPQAKVFIGGILGLNDVLMVNTA